MKVKKRRVKEEGVNKERSFPMNTHVTIVTN